MGFWTASSSLDWSQGRERSSTIRAVLTALAVLAILPYLPFLSLPLISDDYVQIDLARHFSGWKGIVSLAQDPLYRCRATSLWLTYFLDSLFGPAPVAYLLAGLVLHTLNSWLVFALGRWKAIGYRLSAIAAAFFAIYEGHQEAVVWHAASPELLMFAFCLLTLLIWVEWLQTGATRKMLYALSLVAFVLALLSKEAAAAVPLLLAYAAWNDGRLRQVFLKLIPFFAGSLGYTLLAFAAKANHLHFNDGTFSISAPFVLTLLNSGFRLFWFWGLLAAVAIWFLDRRPQGFSGVLPAYWIVVTLLPYSFLTYMMRVPSRHTYWASAGLSLFIAGGILALWHRPSLRRFLPWVAAAMFVHNTSYLWLKKLPQYQERAAVTERFLKFAASEPRAIRVTCFEVSPLVARLAAEIRLGRPGREILEPHDPPLTNGTAQVAEVTYCSGDRKAQP